MKKILFFSSLIISFFSIGQKQIVAISQVEVNFDGSLIQSDSTSYTYNSSSQGGQLTYKPNFELQNGILNFFEPRTRLPHLFHANQSTRFFALDTSFQETATSTNIVQNGLMTESNTIISNNITASSNNRDFYEYNSDNQLTLKVTQYQSNTIWTTRDSIFYTYDSNGNLLTHHSFTFSQNINGSLISGYLDSLQYDPITNKVVEHVNYYHENQVYQWLSKTELIYNGTNVDYVDYHSIFGATITANPEWLYRYSNVYQLNELTSIKTYAVVNGIVSSSVLVKMKFQTDNQGLLTEALTIWGVDTNKIEQYEYDNDGFLTKKSVLKKNLNGIFQEFFTTRFFYAQSLGIEEGEPINVFLYPNPAQNVLNIQSIETVISIQIFNMNGQLVLEQNFGEMAIEQLPKGQYIIVGKTESGSGFSKKFIKK